MVQNKNWTYRRERHLFQSGVINPRASVVSAEGLSSSPSRADTAPSLWELKRNEWRAPWPTKDSQVPAATSLHPTGMHGRYGDTAQNTHGFYYNIYKTATLSLTKLQSTLRETPQIPFYWKMEGFLSKGNKKQQWLSGHRQVWILKRSIFELRMWVGYALVTVQEMYMTNW